jgi:large subunit ribosomal protein L15e
MNAYQHIAHSWNAYGEQARQLWRERLIRWRQEPATTRTEGPTRLDRARALGYKAKQGIFIVRQRVTRGGHRRERPDGGRHSSNMRKVKALREGHRFIAEKRAAQSYPNCEILNSYFVARDGKHEWYEVIMADPQSAPLQASRQYAWLARPAQRGRAFRGITSAGRRSRGLRWSGRGAEKARPSRRSHSRRL